MMYGGLARETGHVTHRPHLSNRNITPEELDGLEAVLKLTERVADQVGKKTCMKKKKYKKNTCTM